MARRNKKLERKIAKQRIKELFEQAEKRKKSDPDLSGRYVELARKIAMRYRVDMPAELKKRFCKKCGAYWIQGKNVKTRTKDGKVVYTCGACGHIRRFDCKKARSVK